MCHQTFKLSANSNQVVQVIFGLFLAEQACVGLQIFLYGNGLRSYILAVVVPSEGLTRYDWKLPTVLSASKQQCTCYVVLIITYFLEIYGLGKVVWEPMMWPAQRPWRWATRRR